MTPSQFEALAKLLRLRNGPAQESARLVLVDGLRPSEAARATGCVLQNVSSAVMRMRRGLLLAAEASGVKTSD